jgi:deazaflavin-dependent oxidoreductase (nitroreductase family)
MTTDTLKSLPYLYLTTTGRKTGLPRQIEIWFVLWQGKFYILAEHFHNAQWVKNIAANSHVHVRVGDQEFDATARALAPNDDGELWTTAQDLAYQKYGWGNGLPVEITPGSSAPTPSPPGRGPG